MSDSFSIGWDPGSLSTITRLMGMEAFLTPEITATLIQSGTLIRDAAVANTWEVFDNPTGRLAGSIIFWVVSPTEVEIQVGVPYGRRREYGFSGHTDSLGRYYANDPAKPYAQPAVDDNRDQVAGLMAVAVENALGRISVV